MKITKHTLKQLIKEIMLAEEFEGLRTDTGRADDTGIPDQGPPQEPPAASSGTVELDAFPELLNPNVPMITDAARSKLKAGNFKGAIRELASAIDNLNNTDHVRNALAKK